MRYQYHQLWKVSQEMATFTLFCRYYEHVVDGRCLILNPYNSITQRAIQCKKDHMSTICTEHIIGDERIVLGCFYPPKVYLRSMIILLCVVWWLGFGLILGPYNSISQVRRGSTLFASTHLNSSVVYQHTTEYTIGYRYM